MIGEIGLGRTAVSSRYSIKQLSGKTSRVTKIMHEIPKTMSAAVLTGHGGYDKLEIHHDWPVPTPQAGEVLIKVAACGINNTDINTRIGWYDDTVEGDSSSNAADGLDSVSDDSVGGWGNTGIQFPRIQGADPLRPGGRFGGWCLSRLARFEGDHRQLVAGLERTDEPRQDRLLR